MERKKIDTQSTRIKRSVKKRMDDFIQATGFGNQASVVSAAVTFWLDAHEQIYKDLAKGVSDE